MNKGKAQTKSAKRQSKTEQKEAPVSTIYTDNGTNYTLDGKQIARNVATYSRMYKVNVDIFRCIKEKQETTMSSGYELHRKNKGNANEKVAEDPDFIKALNYKQSITEMKDDIIQNLDLFGDVYVRRIFNAMSTVPNYTGPKVMGYEILDTRNVKIITDTNLKVLRYIYERSGLGYSKQETFFPEEILHFRGGRNFDNPLFGETVMERLVLDVLGDDQASLVNYFWFENDATPSALYILNEWMGTDEANIQVEKIKAKLSGGHNKGKNIISNAIKDIKPITQKHNDADFLNQRKFTTEKVCVAFGVPRTVLGYIEEANYSNSETQYKKFIANTIRPLERKLEQIFTELSKDFAGFLFVINDEHIDEMEQRSKLARENVKSGIWTINEARSYVGDYEAFEDDMADELIIPSNMQLLGNLAIGEPTPTPVEELPTAV